MPEDISIDFRAYEREFLCVHARGAPLQHHTRTLPLPQWILEPFFVGAAYIWVVTPSEARPRPLLSTAEQKPKSAQQHFQKALCSEKNRRALLSVHPPMDLSRYAGDARTILPI